MLHENPKKRTSSNELLKTIESMKSKKNSNNIQNIYNN